VDARPIEPHEREALEDLGTLIEFARRDAGLTQRQLALAAGFTLRHLQYLEAGQRRTRLSTLARVADFLELMLDTEPDALLDLFVDTAGDSLAPESDYAAKVEYRRQRRARRAVLDEYLSDRLGRVARKRSAPEAKRRAARATERAMRRSAGLSTI
jgi:transcriptional regulator with XRE-family HTH domain